AGRVAERGEKIAARVFGGGQREGRVVHVLNGAVRRDAIIQAGVAGVAENEILPWHPVGAIFVGPAVGSRDLRRDHVGGVGRVGDVEGRAGLRGVDTADLPS